MGSGREADLAMRLHRNTKKGVRQITPAVVMQMRPPHYDEDSYRTELLSFSLDYCFV